MFGPSTLVRKLYHPLAGQAWGPARSHLADLLRLHLARETVGAEHQRVPTTERQTSRHPRPEGAGEAGGAEPQRVPTAERQRSLHLDREVRAEAEGPQHNMGARVVLGLRRAE